MDVHYSRYFFIPQEGTNFQLLLFDLVLNSAPDHQSDEVQSKKDVVKEFSLVASHHDVLWFV